MKEEPVFGRVGKERIVGAAWGTLWLQRPPTRRYWNRGWQVFFSRKYLASNIRHWFARVTADFALNRFIFKRDRARGLTHWLIMWGCILAFAITFPLVFGWIHFETLPGDVESYRTFVFGFATSSFKIHSAVAFLIFHRLVWASFMVIAGVMLAMRRRMRDTATRSSASRRRTSCRRTGSTWERWRFPRWPGRCSSRMRSFLRC